jgi:hypothetical protein
MGVLFDKIKNKLKKKNVNNPSWNREIVICEMNMGVKNPTYYFLCYSPDIFLEGT